MRGLRAATGPVGRELEPEWALSVWGPAEILGVSLACTAQGRGPEETDKGLMPGLPCTGTFTGQCLSEYVVVAVPSGSVSPWAGPAGAEGENWLEEAGNRGSLGPACRAPWLPD